MILEVLDAIIGTIWQSCAKKRSTRFWVLFGAIFGAGIVALLYSV
jgi:hypothetical protein